MKNEQTLEDKDKRKMPRHSETQVKQRGADVVIGEKQILRGANAHVCYCDCFYGYVTYAVTALHFPVKYRLPRVLRHGDTDIWYRMETLCCRFLGESPKEARVPLMKTGTGLRVLHSLRCENTRGSKEQIRPSVLAAFIVRLNKYIERRLELRIQHFVLKHRPSHNKSDKSACYSQDILTSNSNGQLQMTPCLKSVTFDRGPEQAAYLLSWGFLNQEEGRLQHQGVSPLSTYLFMPPATPLLLFQSALHMAIKISFLCLCAIAMTVSPHNQLISTFLSARWTPTVPQAKHSS
ncbi:hypothetical protein JOB18_000263 [Solea senegalensis]|uniref:Uncharacterized protein n=1 Tax=Solea senegalensis TaxID=28829 RepID=A0AAV6T2M0_SOLSE|nr:hypothetical protein JOB18_000263 [Solea senegalensis]